MTNWRNQAACLREDPDLFFPIGTSGPALMQTEQAKAICRRCPVREPCLQYALDSDQAIGVWGGTSETERRAIRRRASRSASRR
ncbi:WhiB family transcriptional regulator [Streptomyces sp. NPDC001595]|uniref:WhiB family transcriptional regulator n=1 Tax=Streptomyces sp. NPDC001532 TaxID=3154520 RepID=UPI0033232775